ncbi:MAG: hypothetical protein RR595_09480 [Lysinibacillus sp.]
MTTLMKWLVVGSVTIIFVLYLVFSSSVQNITTRTLAETDVAMHTVAAGAIRTNLDTSGSLERDVVYIDKEEIVQNLIEDIAKTQKNLLYDVKFDYAFVDATGKTTTVDEKIRGIQYRMQYLDEKGVVKGTAEKHLALNQMK